jgi:hypothetical protein
LSGPRVLDRTLASQFAPGALDDVASEGFGFTPEEIAGADTLDALACPESAQADDGMPVGRDVLRHAGPANRDPSLTPKETLPGEPVRDAVACDDLYACPAAPWRSPPAAPASSRGDPCRATASPSARAVAGSRSRSARGTSGAPARPARSAR